MSNSIAINIKSVSHYYDNRSQHILKNITLDIKKGSIIAVTSANNQEVTTLLKLIAKTLNPHSGSVNIQPSDPKLNLKTEQATSAVFSSQGFISELSLLNNLFLGTRKAKRFLLLNRKRLLKQAKALYDEFGFDLVWHTNCQIMSPQQKREASIVRCFLVNAPIYIFDLLVCELKPEARQIFLSKCQELTEQGCTILFSTKTSQEAINYCSSLLILRRGEVSFFSDPGNLSQGELRCLIANNIESSKLAITEEIKLLFSVEKDPVSYIRQALNIPSLFLGTFNIFCVFKDHSGDIHFTYKFDSNIDINALKQLVTTHFCERDLFEKKLKINTLAFQIEPMRKNSICWGLIGIQSDMHSNKNIQHIFPLKTYLNTLANSLHSLLSEQVLHHQLQQKQRLSSLGSLAGGLVHDINNALFTISGSAELLLVTDNKEKQEQYVETILKIVCDTRELTSKLLSFSKKGSTIYKIHDVHKLLNDSLAVITTNNKIRIKKDFLASQTNIECDASEIRNAIANIMLNAFHAVDPINGVIQILTYNHANIAGELDYEGNLLPDDSIVISVIDNGHGIATDDLKKIFDPFYSSRVDTGGAGLGLSVVYGTIKEHNGCFNIISSLSQGTEFSIYLPISQVQANEDEVVVNYSSTSFEGKCILLCDDNKHVQLVLKQMLESLGIIVLVADNGKDCINTFNSRWEEIDLLILDDIMPVMSGRECFYELKSKYAALSAILLTGYRDEYQIEQLLNDGLLGIYKKPMLHNELVTMLNQVFNSNHQT